jgi:hypothetical protein
MEGVVGDNRNDEEQISDDVQHAQAEPPIIPFSAVSP